VALAEVIRGEQRGAWPAAHAIGLAIAHNRDAQPAPFRELFLGLIDRLRDVPIPTADESARSVRVMLACAAAALDDLDRFLSIADPALPWELAWSDGSARWVKGRSPVARLFDALAARGATYGDAVDGLHAMTQAMSSSAGRSRDRASAIALTLVRRTLRERASLEPPDRLGALVDGLVRFWTASGSVPPAHPATDTVERAARRFLGVDAPGTPGGDPRRIAAELSRALAESSDASGDTELIGWVIAALDRAHAGALSDFTVRSVAALLDDQRRISPQGELVSQVGRVLLHFATTDAAFVFRPAWLEIVRHVDDAPRRELLTRALAWVARGYASGRFTVGAFADACAVAGGEGGTIDDATVELLVPHLAAASTSRGAALPELTILTATVASVATPAAAERLADALLGAADPDTADRIRMHRLALALQEIERVRDEDRYAEARAALRRVLSNQALGADEERALRTFLGVDDGSVIGRLMSRLPRLSNGSVAIVGDRQ
jgi:hypothetical protein